MGMDSTTSVVYGFLAPLTEENVSRLADYAGGYEHEEVSDELTWRVLELKSVPGVNITAYYTESLGREMPEVLIVTLPGVGVENSDGVGWVTVPPTYLTPPENLTPEFQEVQELLGAETAGWILYSHVS